MNVKTKRILILEDNPGDVYLLEKRLAESEYSCITSACESQETFESLIEECKPDLILADINLQGYDGYQALEYAKKACPEIPFLFVTGSVGAEQALDLVRKGALDVVFKENLERLEDAVFRAVQVAEDRKTLHETMTLNKMLSEVSKVGAWEYEVATGESNWSSEVARIYERDTDEAPPVDKGLSYYKEGWSRDLIARSFKDAIEKGIPYDHELLLITEKGNEKWIRTIGKPEMKGDRCIRVYGTFQDVTERKKEEEKAKQLAERHQLVLDATEAAVWDWNLESDEAIIDKGAERIFGHDLNDIARLNDHGEYVFSFEAFRKWIHPDDAARVAAKLEEHILGRSKDYEQQYRARTKAGTVIWLYSKGKIVKRGSHGEAIRMLGTMVDITDIREASESFETLFMYSPFAKLVFSKKSMEIVLANQKAADLYGYTIGELKGMPIYLLKGITNVIANEELVKRELNKRLNENVSITEHTRKDGQVLTVEAHHTLMNYKGEEVVVLAVKDVTEKIKAEKKIQQLSLVASKTTNGIVITDKDERMTWVNSGFEKLTGYSADEMIGRNPNMFQGEDTSDEAKGILRKAIDSGEPAQVEILNYHKKGHPYWVEIFLDPVKDADGNIQNFIAIENDITERKDREKELKTSKELIEKTLYELSYQKFALDQHCIVSITDANGRINYVNDKFCKISKYTEEELLGQDHRIINSGHHPQSFFDDLYETISAGKVWHAEIQNKAKDGSLYWIDTTITPFVNDITGHAEKYISISNDITQRKRMEKELRETLDGLEEMVEERTEDLTRTKQELQSTHDDLLSSVRYAKRIQLALLPSKKELRQLFTDAFVTYLPKDIVSGDFFWQKKINGGVLFSVIDCTGHGVPGAMMSMLGNDLLDKIVTDMRIIHPPKILEALNKEINNRLKRHSAKLRVQDGMDMSVCYLDYETHDFVFAGARSHGLYYQKNKDGFIALRPDRLSIGGDGSKEEKKFSETRLKWEKGDRFYLFSDGVYDQWGGEKGKKILRKPFMRFLEETASLPIGEQGTKVIRFYRNWKGDEMQADDVTVVGIEI